MDRLLKNLKIYDGTGSEPFVGDILIRGERIAEVGKELKAEGVPSEDMAGLSASSGFIDAHSHNDWFAVRKEPLKYFEPFIRQGITTFVAGNCGLSATGFEPDTPNIDKIGGGLFGYHGDTTGVYSTVGELLAAVDRKMPCNLATLMGHCSARASLAGYENRPLTEQENEKMLGILEQGLKDGACGLSLGLMYEPGIYADLKELKGVADLCVKYDVPMTVHPKAESTVSLAYPQLIGRPHILRAMDDLYEIAKGTPLKLQYSHAIFVGRKTFRCKDEVLSILKKMRAEGIDAKFDIYDETLGVSVITVVLPDWYQSLTPEQKRAPFNKLKLSVLAKVTIRLLGFGWKDIQIAWLGTPRPEYEGKTVAEIAKATGKSCLDAYLDLCDMSDCKGRVNMGPYSTDKIISELCREDDCLYMTDGWVEDNGVQNPVIYDCFPKFLKRALTGNGDTMPRAIRKMTGAIAERFNLKDRGVLRAGAWADLTVFDEEELKNGIPDQKRAFGIRQVYINGTRVLRDGKLDAVALRTTGRAIRCGEGGATEK